MLRQRATGSAAYRFSRGTSPVVVADPTSRMTSPHSVIGRPSTRLIELFFEKGLFHLDHDYLGPIQLQKHALSAETIPEAEVQRRYLETMDLDADEFEGMLRYSLEDYAFLRALTEGLGLVQKRFKRSRFLHGR